MCRCLQYDEDGNVVVHMAATVGSTKEKREGKSGQERKQEKKRKRQRQRKVQKRQKSQSGSADKYPLPRHLSPYRYYAPPTFSPP